MSRLKKVAVGMSGGVDSSVAAALLKTQGFDVLGVHFQFAPPKSEICQFQAHCLHQKSVEDVQKLCRTLDIPFYSEDATKEYEHYVVDYVINEALQLRRSHPCIPCNMDIRIHMLARKAKELGCDLIATGHYAQVHLDVTTGLARLLKAVDTAKDQSYFLFRMDQELLKKTLMPLGSLTHQMVEKLALEFEFKPHSHPSLPSLCYKNDASLISYIDSHSTTDLRPNGVIRNPLGVLVGDHEGLYRFQLGQKENLPTFNQEKTEEEFVVVKLSQNDNELILGSENQLGADEVLCKNTSWVRKLNQIKGLQCGVKISPESQPQGARITSFENGYIHIRFDQPQKALMPGQAMVFYQESEVLGGTYINKVLEESIEEQVVKS